MLLSNLESVPGHTIRQQIDVVYGSTVRSKHVGRDLLAGLKNIVGGELTAYTELLEEESYVKTMEKKYRDKVKDIDKIRDEIIEAHRQHDEYLKN